MCAIAVTVDRILRNTFTSTLYFLYGMMPTSLLASKGGIRLQLDKYPACIRSFVVMLQLTGPFSPAGDCGSIVKDQVPVRSPGTSS